MKTLSLTQPWATLVAIGAKHFETRSWSTSYRGPIAIHASKRFPRDAIAICFEQPFGKVLHASGIVTPSELPLGAVIAIAELVDIQPTARILGILSDQEDAFGDYSPGRYAWHLTNVRKLPEPVPARGSLGLWDWAMPVEVAA